MQIKLREGTIDIPEQNFLTIIEGMVNNSLMMARSIAQDHSLGNINRTGTTLRELLWSEDEVTRSITDAIRDQELSTLIEAFRRTAKALLSHDQQITRWVYGYFDIPYDLDPKNLARFSRRISRERRKASDDRTGLLSWVPETEYKDLVMGSIELVDDLGRVADQILLRIKGLRTPI
jgi:hypothetical protein